MWMWMLMITMTKFIALKVLKMKKKLIKISDKPLLTLERKSFQHLEETIAAAVLRKALGLLMNNSSSAIT